MFISGDDFLGETMDALLTGLRAAAEPTRLRLLALCAHGDLTVGELTSAVGQSQPRVSRHLKVLCDGGLLERFPEGNSVFYALARGVAEHLVALLPDEDPILTRDRRKLNEIFDGRRRAVEAYFAGNAARWDEIRSFDVPEAEVEAELCTLVRDLGAESLLDIGTGTARIVELCGPLVRHAVGVDISREMLAVGRVNLERSGQRNCALRHGDMYALPFTAESFDVAVLHQVLHFAEKPAEILLEASRVIRQGGKLIIVDLARHEHDSLRSVHAHRRLGFADEEVREWAARAGFAMIGCRPVVGEKLTVLIWHMERLARGRSDGTWNMDHASATRRRDDRQFDAERMS